LVPTLSISDNIWIGREKQFGNRVFRNKTAQSAATVEILHRLGLSISPNTEVSRLSIAEMQLVEIARAISYDSDIIIMDEPTSAITDTEVNRLYEIIRSLSKQGKTIIYISHKLDEIFSICNSVTVLRDGTFIARKPITEVTENTLVSMMVGRNMSDLYPKVKVKIGEPVLEVENISRAGAVNNVSFYVRQGEILGLAGLMGAGRTEIVETIFGIHKSDRGTIKLHGKKTKINTVPDAIRQKIAMVTEDRRHTGVVHSHTVKANESLAYLNRITKMGFVDTKQETADVHSMSQKLSIKTPSFNTIISQLSGGNQQKVIIAKWLLTEPEVLILDEPTRGIDVGAKAEIYRLIGELAKLGKAIIVVSSELPEVMGLSDRILVIRNGSIVAEYYRENFDSNTIMKSAFGIQ
jgi:ABC-type sugar transport system ATPase subunit